MYDREKNTIRCRLYRQKNREKIREIKRLYRLKVSGEKERQKNYGDRTCRLCEILLRSQKFGGHGKKYYCDRCINEGRARLHWQRLGCKNYRKRLKRKKVIHNKPLALI